MKFAIRLAAIVLCLTFPAAASASQLVAPNAKNISLSVNKKGIALVNYTARGKKWHVLYWGGINKSHGFKYDRSGGWRSGKGDWKTHKNACRKYDGPKLRYAVATCKAADGSYWALQRWIRIKPNYGGSTGPVELRLSHWTGPLANFWVKTDWSWGGQWEHLYGQLTYRGSAIYPRKQWGSLGECMADPHCRNLSIESYNSDYGPGWRRVNMFLAHAPNGQFCFGFAPKGGSPYTGRSKVGKYVAQVAGPYVSPDVFTDFSSPGSYNAAFDAVANQEQIALRGGNLNSNCAKIN